MNTEFIKTYHLIKNDILRLAFSYTRNISDAEDITQEVFTKLYENFNDFEDIEYIKKWCIKVTINKCKNLFLSSWNKKVSFFTDNNENKIPDIDNITKENTEVLDTLLNMPKKYRIVLVLYYYEEYKIKEISEILKISESTIQTRLQRGREQLKKLLMGVKK
ncbi:MAG: sigma-70 family RNA polymerase sigma factor [Bacilli bacterium]|nr:sigma-70 family RNA polymerase sigma factor [Bacilli bacterium]